MGKFQKADPALVAELDAALEAFPGVDRRRMFGSPAAFVNGQLFAGVHEDKLLVRVPEAAAQHPFAPMGHPTREYAALPGALDWPAGELQAWLRRAYEYARALPPKEKAPAKSRVKPAPAKAAKPASLASAKKSASAKSATKAAPAPTARKAAAAKTPRAVKSRTRG